MSRLHNLIPFQTNSKPSKHSAILRARSSKSLSSTPRVRWIGKKWILSDFNRSKRWPSLRVIGRTWTRHVWGLGFDIGNRIGARRFRGGYREFGPLHSDTSQAPVPNICGSHIMESLAGRPWFGTFTYLVRAFRVEQAVPRHHELALGTPDARVLYCTRID